MKKSIRVFACWGLALLASSAGLYADTIPGGDVSGTWYQANSPYYIAGNISIPAGDTLVIEPGVVVSFLGNYCLFANGVLKAVGTASDSIRFSRQDTTNTWGGINLEGDLTYTLSYCSFSRATGVLETGLDRYNQELIISNCSFGSNTQAVCVREYWYDGKLKIADCYFGHNGPANNGGAVSLGVWWDWISGKMEITGCVFEHNTANDNGGAISVYLLADGDSVSYVSIRDCVFIENAADSNGGAIGCRDMENDSSTVIENCTFIRNTIDQEMTSWKGGGAIGADGSDFRISHCCFIENHAAITYDCIYLGNALGSSHFHLDHCTFKSNHNDEVKGNLDIGSSLQVRNCIFTNCTQAINVAGPLSVYYSDFYDNTYNVVNSPAGFGVLDRVNYIGDSCDCYYNIFLDPLYVDTLNHDFHLTAGSHCIDAGDPAFAYDPDGTVSDQGCYWFDQRAPAIALSDSALDFGGVTVGSQANLLLTIYNQGTADLVVSGMTNSLAVFTTDYLPADSLIPPGDSLALTVTFAPADTFPACDTLIITNNDHSLMVALSGTGLPTGVAGPSTLLGIPATFGLRLCKPNPARGSTSIEYQLPKECRVALEIYSITGQLVKRFDEGMRQPGYYSVSWNTSRQPAGVYFYRLKAGSFAATRKMVVIR
jgi:hypothetical protein